MSVNLAASQTPRLSMSASDNLRTEYAYLIDLKWRIQVTLLCKRQLKAPLGWFCLPTWGHAPDWVRPIWARQASTLKRSQHENLRASHGALARAGSEGYRGEKPLSLLPPAPLASLHRGSHLSEDPGCQHKRTVCLLANAHPVPPPSERRSAHDYVWILSFVPVPLGTRLYKFAGTDIISSRCHQRLHQAGTHVAQQHRRECTQTSVG